MSPSERLLSLTVPTPPADLAPDLTTEDMESEGSAHEGREGHIKEEEGEDRDHQEDEAERGASAATASGSAARGRGVLHKAGSTNLEEGVEGAKDRWPAGADARVVARSASPAPSSASSSALSTKAPASYSGTGAVTGGATGAATGEVPESPRSTASSPEGDGRSSLPPTRIRHASMNAA